MSANGSHCRRARHRVLERALELVDRLGEHDRPAVHLGSNPGLHLNSGSRSSARVHLHRAAARAATAPSPCTKSSGRTRPVEVAQERDLRVHRGDHDVGIELLAAHERDAGDAAVPHLDPADLGARADLRAEPLRRRAHRRRSRRPCRPRGSPTSRAAGRRRRPRPPPPPPSPAAPGARRARVAELVVQHHVRRPRRARPRPRADHAAHGQRAAHRVGSNRSSSRSALAHRHQPRHVGHAALVELAQPPQPAAAPRADPAAACCRAAAAPA